VETAIVAPPERIDGASSWCFDGGGLRVAFLGRGVPPRERRPGARLLPGDVERCWLRQVHSSRVLDAPAPGLRGEGDALVVRVPRLAAEVATADCVPVLIASDAGVAAIHAGWRGIAAGVVPAALARLGGRHRRAWIGPGIGPCCYEVGEEVARAVTGASTGEARRPGSGARPHLDLARAVVAQLDAEGVGTIVRVEACTRCRGEWLWSHRRDGAGAGRNLSFIWLE
jgi:YfiH family protein